MFGVAPSRLCVKISFLPCRADLSSRSSAKAEAWRRRGRANLTKMVMITMPPNSVFLSLLRLFAANLHKCLSLNHLQPNRFHKSLAINDCCSVAGFLAVFGGMPLTIGAITRVSPNPKGIESISPGLRGTSYPGGKTEKSQTLKGLHLFHKSLQCNPFRVVVFLGTTQRGPSLNRANAGLNDTIPLGLKNRSFQQVRSPIPYSSENSEEPYKSFQVAVDKRFTP